MIKIIRYWIIRAVGVSKGEANALLVLVPLLLSTIIIPPFLHKYLTNNYSNHTSDQAILDSLVASIEKQQNSKLKAYNQPKISHIPFDPNSSSVEILISNGIPKYLANRIISYRSKGGQFRKKEDLLKIYGFEDKLYQTLSAYVRIEVNNNNKQTKNRPFESKRISYKKEKIENFDINMADTSTLKQIYGIGDKLSVRVIKFRDKLGGFVHTDQLHLVYGLQPEVIDSLLIYASISNSFAPIQVNINTDTIQHLSQHPFIDYKLAKAIINYRRQHGEYKQSIDLKKIHLMNDSVYNKIYPYLKLAD